MKKALASLISASIVALAPGLGPYRACANSVGAVQVPANVGTPSIGAAGAGIGTAAQTGAGPVSGGLNASITPTLPGTADLAPNVRLDPKVPGISAAAAPNAAAPNAVQSLIPAARPKTLPAAAAPKKSRAPPAARTAPKTVVSRLSAAPAIKQIQAGKDLPAALDTLFTNTRSRQSLNLAAPLGKPAAAPGSRRSGLGKSSERGSQAAPAVDFLKKSKSPDAAAPKKSPWTRIKESFSGFDRSEKSFIVGQSVFLFALSIYLATLPLLVQALTGDAAMTGVARAVHYWVFAGASLVSGSVVRRSPMKRVLVGSALTRAMIFSTIGFLALSNILPWSGFLVLVGVNAAIVSMNHLVDIDTDGARKVFKNDKNIEQAGYIYDFIYYGMMLVVPPLIGIPMDFLDSVYGAGIGAAVGFTAFGIVMSVAAFIYARFVRVRGERFAEGPVGGLLKKVRGLGTAAWEILTEIPRRNLATAKLIWNNKKILSRSMMATAENFIEDALFAVVLPSFAIDILKAGATGNGILLSAVTFGGLLASTFLVRYAQKIQNRIGTYKFLTYLTLAAAFAFIPSIGLWTAPSLLWAIPIVAAMKLFYQPLRSRMRALLQVEIKNDPRAKDHSQEIFSLMTVVEVIAAGAGGLVFSWLFLHAGAGTALFSLLGAYAPMKVVTLALMGISGVYLIGLRMLKGQLPRWKRYSSAEGAEAKEYEKLEKNLATLRYKSYKTVKVSEPVDADRPTVAILAPASTHKLAMAAEGGRQSPGDVHLALDPSWLIQERHPDGRTTLLLKKGLFFDEDGQPWVAEYSKPRPVRYFANFFTVGANERGDGVPLEAGLDVPMSSSEELEHVTNDKLFTRLLMAAKGVAVPATLALLMAAHPLAADAQKYSRPPSGIAVEAMPDEDERDARVRSSVEDYLKTHAEKLKGRVVVKPSGPAWHSSKGVKFFDTADVDGIVAHVLALAKDGEMTSDGAVLIDSRLTPPPIYFRSKLLDSDDASAHDDWAIRVDGRVGLDFLDKDEIAEGDVGRAKKDYNIRLLVARTPWGGAELMDSFVRAGAWGIPTVAEPGGANADWDPEDAAVVLKYENMISMLQKQHGLLQTHDEVDDFVRKLEALGEGVFASLEENETTRTRKDGSPYQARSDFIGLDVMLQLEDGVLTPYVIEVNDHDSGGQMHLEHFYPGTPGRHSRAWVATMLARARRDSLKGKTILIVGGGYEGKRFFFERAKKLGVRVVLIDKPGSWAKDLVDEYIEADTLDHAEAAKTALAELEARGLKGELNGITAFWEDDVPLTAALSEALELPYFSEASAASAREKSLTRKVMEEAGLPTPRFAKVTTFQELGPAIKKVGFPAILKPASGAEAKFVKEVRSVEEAEAAFLELKQAVEVEAEVDGAFSRTAAIVLEEYLDGDEVDVDIVMRGGKPVFTSLTDNWPTQRPFFLATGSNLPSRLPAASQDALTDLAIKSAQALGLETGILHVEGKMTSRGPRIIEVNARLGGVYVHDWVRAVWGVDLVEEGLMAAASIPGRPYKSKRPLTYLEGQFLIPEESGRLTQLDYALPDPALFELKRMKKVGTDVRVPPDGNDRVGMLTAKGGSSEEAQAKLDILKKNLKMVIQPDGQD